MLVQSACGESTNVQCPARIESELQGGASAPALWQMDDNEPLGVVALQTQGLDIEAARLCSGVMVEQSTILTAKHCVSPDVQRVVLRNNVSLTEVSVEEVTLHPTLDLALVRAAYPVAQALQVRSTLIIHGFDFQTGHLAQVAGYGSDGTELADSVTFAVEEVASVDAEYIAVTGSGFGGACNGDSGGPLLLRAPGGRLSVAGILSYGHTSCRDVDRYVRIDAAMDWLKSQLHDSAFDFGHDVACGVVTNEGNCINGAAVFCSDNELVVSSCAASTPCGWDSNAGGFRCLYELKDSCEGVDFFGACEDGKAIRCQSGRIETNVCDSCSGGLCVRSPSSGVASCFLP